MSYEWHEPKRRANRSRHGIDFEDVVDFVWDSALIRTDLRFEYHEIRYSATGSLHGRLVVLVFTERGGTVRVISLRRANSHERKEYWDQFEN